MSLKRRVAKLEKAIRPALLPPNVIITFMPADGSEPDDDCHLVLHWREREDGGAAVKR